LFVYGDFSEKKNQLHRSFYGIGQRYQETRKGDLPQGRKERVLERIKGFL